MSGPSTWTNTEGYEVSTEPDRLDTADAHGLYERHGFAPPAAPDIHLFVERSPGELWP